MMGDGQPSLVRTKLRCDRVKIAAMRFRPRNKRRIVTDLLTIDILFAEGKLRYNIGNKMQLRDAGFLLNNC